MFDVAVFGSLFLTLFVIMDPPGITPIFLALTAGRPTRVQRRMALQAVSVAFGVIAVFGLLGQQILDYLHVSVPALMIAGGLLLLLIALDLLTGKTDEPAQTKDVNVALVPLGMPLLADYLTSSRFWFESFQNWQSEFLAIASPVPAPSSR